jgi:uncharacterized membrane protein (GlpM family)
MKDIIIPLVLAFAMVASYATCKKMDTDKQKHTETKHTETKVSQPRNQ